MLGLGGICISLVFGVINVIKGVSYGAEFGNYSLVFMGLLLIIFGCAGSLILSILIYGFGHLIQNVDRLLYIKRTELLMDLKLQVKNKTITEAEFLDKRRKIMGYDES